MTTRVADLGGWALARVTIEMLPGNALAASLTLMEPEGDDTPAKSFEVVGVEEMLKLKDLIEDTVAAFELEQSLPRELDGRPLTTGGG